jgi:long-chain acyl-CoA synthetase
MKFQLKTADTAPFVVECKTLLDVFHNAVAQNPDATFLSSVVVEKNGGSQIVDLSYKEIAYKVYALADYLQHQGIGIGDPVAVVADNCPENVIALLAALHVGAILVPIYPFDLKQDTIQYQLQLSEVKAILYENEGQKKRLGTLPLSVKVRISFADFGAIFSNPDLSKYAPKTDLSSSDMFLHLYTSGSSGTPKGVVRDHAGVLANLVFFDTSGIFKKGDRVLSILPFPHIFPLAVLFMAIKAQCALVLTSSQPAKRARKNPIDMRNAWTLGNCDTLILVPRILEKIKETIEKQVKGNRLAELALASGLAAYRCKVDSLIAKHYTEAPVGFTPPTSNERALALLAPALAFVRRAIVTKALGKKMRQVATGGSALSYQVGEFYEALGVPILQGYGSTEAGITHAQLPDGVVPGLHRIPGNVGVPLSKDIALQFDGELGLMIHAPTMMREYYKNKEATDGSFKQVGNTLWYRSSDAAHLVDAFNSLVISGRHDRLYKNDGGEKVQPEPVEDLLRGHPLIENAVVWGSDKPRNIAILSLDKAAVDAWHEDASKRGTSQASLGKELDEWITKAVNPLLARPSQVSGIIIAAEAFSTENDLLTGNGKVRYKKVLERYNAEIEAAFGG